MTAGLLPNLASLAAVTAPSTSNEVLLPLLLLVPILGAIIVAFIKDASFARTTALGVAIATLVLSVLLILKAGGAHAWAAPGFLQLENLSDAGGRKSFSFTLGSDAISGWLIALTAILTPCAMLATRDGIERARSYFAWMLLLEAACIGVFLAGDLLLFYVFFELTLVPSFFLIGQWGGVERRQAATKFFVYTFTGSLFMLASILYVTYRAGTFNIADCAAFMQSVSGRERFWVLLGLLAGLCVKVPLLPLHTWLPVTYSNAPAPVTALLSGVLAKLGTYGLLRLAVPMGMTGLTDQTADDATRNVMAILVTVSTLGIVYAALVAWVQLDFKLLLAYSSISHLGFCVLALCTGSTMGGQAAVLYMIDHGISTAALFFMLGMIENRTGTRSIDQVSGLGRERPRMAFFFVLFVMSSIGLPLTNGFVSEFLSLQSAFAVGMFTAGALAATGVVLGAIYMLHLTAKLFFGPQQQPATVTDAMPDLTGREMTALVPLAILVIALGVQPNVVLDPIRQPVASLMTPNDSSLSLRGEGGGEGIRTGAQTSATEDGSHPHPLPVGTGDRIALDARLPTRD